jgi:hypothetical protein
VLYQVIRSQSTMSLRSTDSYRSSVKANPVKKYQDYQKMWNRHKVPGEKKHSDLRWSIREQMLEKHVIVKVNIKIRFIIKSMQFLFIFLLTFSAHKDLTHRISILCRQQRSVNS